MHTDILELIKTRRSVRKFKKKDVPQSVIGKIIEAGRWAPSGLNNQPWRFLVLEKEKKDLLSWYTKYADIVKSANKAILVFLDKKAMYHYEKDLLAIGACIENMLLYIHAIGLGACWLGEIVNKREEINNWLSVPNCLQLEAVIAVGRPADKKRKSNRKIMSSLMAEH